MSTHNYCREQRDRGLTCRRDNLVLLRRLMESSAARSRNIQHLYQCRKCQSLHKYSYTSSYKSRNFDEEGGWDVLCDRFFKVGEIWVSDSPFPVKEARIYGYRDKDLTVDSPEQLPDFPDIAGDELIFIWDQIGQDSVVCYGRLVVWRETTGWEVYERFEELLEQLKRKCGERLVDVFPMLRSQYALYGDSSRAWFRVQDARLSLSRRE